MNDLTDEQNQDISRWLTNAESEFLDVLAVTLYSSLTLLMLKIAYPEAYVKTMLQINEIAILGATGHEVDANALLNIYEEEVLDDIRRS